MSMVDIRCHQEVTDLLCDTAAEFIEILNPLSGPYLQSPTLPTYIFRGVSSSEYQLLPSAYRSEAHLLNGPTWVRAPLPSIGDQCRAEVATLQRFVEIASRHGIRLPEDSQVLRTQLESWHLHVADASTVDPLTWPTPEFLSIIALAQHYRVPTRALDWTWNPLVAAYFAARDAMGAEEGQIAVWVFNYLAKFVDQIFENLFPSEWPLRLFSAPGADNQNLRAQRGLFMLEVHKITDAKAPFTARPYDQLFPDSLPGAKDLCNITRVLLPAVQAASVVRYLSAADITGGSLFPGLGGVARELDEERILSLTHSPFALTQFGWDLQARIASVAEQDGATRTVGDVPE
jgi:hypothetical protein